MFETKRISADPDSSAPDGSDVRILLALQGGGLAHFELAPGEVSRPVAHRSVEEIWLFVAGRGEMWRSLDGDEAVVDVESGITITIPVGTHFQFRTIGDDPLAAVAVTMPPWPGDDEAYSVDGNWRPTV